MLNKLENRRLLLGSKSSRRAELLNLLGWSYEQIDLNADETFSDDMDRSHVAEHLAIKKSNSYSDLQTDEILITADTVVVLENRILGKPKDSEEAVEMLRDLSGKQHQVITGICIRDTRGQRSASSSTLVTFKHLGESEIEYYVHNFKPFDKAGAYGIQEWIGAVAVESIQGSYYNVMGLPVHLLYNKMSELIA